VEVPSSFKSNVLLYLCGNFAMISSAIASLGLPTSVLTPLHSIWLLTHLLWSYGIGRYIDSCFLARRTKIPPTVSAQTITLAITLAFMPSPSFIYNR